MFWQGGVSDSVLIIMSGLRISFFFSELVFFNILTYSQYYYYFFLILRWISAI